MIGNLTRDPELRHLDSGTAVAKLGLATSRRYTARDGEQREDVCFIDVDVWGRQAENCSQYLSKGRQVLVEGTLQLNQWETETGEKRSRHVIQARTVRFLDSPRDREDSGFVKEEGDSGYTRSEPSFDRPSGGRGFSGGDQSEPSDEPIDDDIPF